MFEEDLKQVATCIMVAEGIGAHEALADARVIAKYDDDIKEAAIAWARTGEMSSTPTIEGENPLSLNKDYYPTQTFDILSGLRAHPERTKQALKHLRGRDDYGPDRLEPNVKFGELLGRLFLLWDEARQLHDEAIAIGLDTPFTERLDKHAKDARFAHDQLHESLLTKNMVRHNAVPRKNR